jgi:hypothetical protein
MSKLTVFVSALVCLSAVACNEDPAPPAPISSNHWSVTAAPCTLTQGPDDSQHYFADLAYEGRSKADLARASAIRCTPGEEYCLALPVTLVRDGALRVMCNGAGETVTFSVPPGW